MAAQEQGSSRANAGALRSSEVERGSGPALPALPPEHKGGFGGTWKTIGAALVGGTTLTAFATLVGWLYWEGYLVTLDTPSELFPQEARQLFLNNYTVALTLLGGLLPKAGQLFLFVLGAPASVGVVAFLVVAITQIKQSRAVLDRFRSSAHRHINHPLLLPAAVGSVTVVGTVAFFFLISVIVISLLALPLVGYKAGKIQAGDLLQKQACRPTSNMMLPKGCAVVQFKTIGIRTGLYIASNDKAIALRIGGRTQVFHDERVSIEFGAAGP